MVITAIFLCAAAQLVLAASFVVADRGRSATCLFLAAIAGAVNSAMGGFFGAAATSIGSCACAFAGVLVLEAMAAALQADIRLRRTLHWSLALVVGAAAFGSEPRVARVALVHILFSAALTADLLATFRGKIAPVFHGATAILFFAAAGGPLLAQTGRVFFLHSSLPLVSVPLSAAYLALCGLLFFHLPLFDLSQRPAKAALLGVIYTLLFFLMDAAFLLAWHDGVFLFNPMSARFWIVAVLLGALASLGPLVFIMLVRRNFMLSGYQTSGLAHELKSPVSIIHNGLEFLRESGHDAGRADYVQMLRNNAERLRLTIESLRSIDAIQQGSLLLERRPLSLSPVLKSHISRLLPLAEQKNISFLLECAEDLQVKADPEKLDQVLSNLLSNAVKFSSHGTVRVSASQQGRDVLVQVRDEGSGMDRRELARIFDRFYQGRTAARGTGLGLAIAKGFVEAHGGRIWARSAGPGQGATLLFTLPRSVS